MTRLLAALAVSLLAASAAAQPTGDDPDDGHRYPDQWIVPRMLDTLWRAPLSVTEWSAPDWIAFGAVGASTVALMWQADPSLDVRIRDEVRKHQGSTANTLLPRIKALDSIIVFSTAVTSIAVTGWLTDSERLLEYDSLLIETLGVNGVYTNLLKFVAGRDAPFDSDDDSLHGPQLQFPRGTPSGHMSSFYATVALTTYYWDSIPLTIGLHAVGAWYALSLLHNDQHYLSDIVTGGALGYAVGTWVAHHHASRPTPERSAWRLQPSLLPGGVGLTLDLAVR